MGQLCPRLRCVASKIAIGPLITALHTYDNMFSLKVSYRETRGRAEMVYSANPIEPQTVIRSPMTVGERSWKPFSVVSTNTPQNANASPIIFLQVATSSSRIHASTKMVIGPV